MTDAAPFIEILGNCWDDRGGEVRSAGSLSSSMVTDFLLYPFIDVFGMVSLDPEPEDIWVSVMIINICTPRSTSAICFQALQWSLGRSFRFVALKCGLFLECESLAFHRVCDSTYVGSGRKSQKTYFHNDRFNFLSGTYST